MHHYKIYPRIRGLLSIYEHGNHLDSYTYIVSGQQNLPRSTQEENNI